MDIQYESKIEIEKVKNEFNETEKVLKMKILELKGDSFDVLEKHKKEIKMHISEIERLQGNSIA